MPIISFRIRDEKTQQLFDNYCISNGLSKGEAFERMVHEYCKGYSVPNQHDDVEKSQDLKKGFINHLLKCFEEDGGTLLKFNRYFYRNEKYLVYPYYRRLGEKESKMVTIDGTQVERLIRLAEIENRIPLLAVFVASPQGPHVLGVMRIEHIPRIQAVQGMRYSWAHVFLREDNNAIYIHVRVQQDFDAIQDITRKSLSDAMLKKIYMKRD